MAATRLDVTAVGRSWDEQTATWKLANASEPWPQGEFSPVRDSAAAVAKTIATPDQGSDIAEPPVVLDWDVTMLVREWLEGKRENLGLAVRPIVDRMVDDGHFTRLQVFVSESRDPRVGPELELRW